jgi:NAD(P)-dependent dehydrogenase (short-subunit alcohol dehydrogenase family)
MPAVPDLFSLAGRVAVVTGGASLYGRQLLIGLAEAGATVVTASRSKATLDEAAKQIADEHGHTIHTCTYDQAEEASILALRDEVKDRFGSCNILVNNAVHKSMVGHGYSGAAATFAQSMQINATGIFIITRAFGDWMVEQGHGGAIVNIASIHGMIAPDPWLYEGTPHSGWYPDYFFHKAGMINFTRFVASYYGEHGIRCNSVSPGGYETPAHAGRFKENYVRRTFLGRMADDDDLKGAVVFLASDAAAYVTGANLPVDAGYTAK